MKYIIYILIAIIVWQGFVIKDLKQKHPAIVVVPEADEFIMSLPTVPKEMIRGLND